MPPCSPLPGARLLALQLFASASLASVTLPPMLNLPVVGPDPGKIVFAQLPVIDGPQGAVTVGAAPWLFRLHSYLAYFEGKYWCMWSHGPVIEDKPTQHIRYATSIDGLKWSEDKLIAGPPPGESERYISRGLWVRSGKLFALATLDSLKSARAEKAKWGADLRLLGFEWDSARQRWKEPIVIFADTLSNFPPQKLPGGEWAMTRRDHMGNVTMLVGGVTSPSAWVPREIVAGIDPTRDFRPGEPEWWVLPDGRALGLFRDNGGSKRLFRALSTDGARTWSVPEQTNFPDARSKFFGLRTSRGFYVLVSNANPAKRHPLCLSVSEDGVVFTGMARLPIRMAPEGGAIDVDGQGGSVQYPHVIEQDGMLFICFSRKKTSIEVVRLSLDDVDRLRTGKRQIRADAIKRASPAVR